MKIERYAEFDGKIPEDVLKLIPKEDQRPFVERIVKNAKGKAIIGWKTQNNFPYPIVKELQLNSHTTF